MELNVCFLRHGETLLNELKKNQGWIDSDLTDTGKKLLKKTYKQKKLPKFDAVYCSDLNRAMETLKFIEPELELVSTAKIVYSKLLRERFLGSFEGDDLVENRLFLSQKEHYKDFEEFMNQNTFWDFLDITKKHDPLLLAENFSEFSVRIDSIVADIIKEGKKYNHKNILVVSHANTIKYMIEKIAGVEYTKSIKNGKIIELIIDI